MKNNLLIFFIFIFLRSFANAEDLLIQSKVINIDKKKETTIFEDEVTITTSENNIIKSEYAEYNKETGIIILKRDIEVIDNQNNKFKSNYAIYNEKLKTLSSIGNTEIITSENYVINSSDIVFDDLKKYISSDKETVIIDQDNNRIVLDNFEYLINDFIFKSVGNIKVEDYLNNTYNFSQVYIDTKKKELLGTDIKTFINNDNFKINKNNKPRIFSNTIKISNEITSFDKSRFTLCDYRKNDKCPPWTIQSANMLHDRKKKTIYYKNALIKVYDIPVFYTPRLSHPDPSVDRRSGFLVPSFEDTKNLGEGLTIPYFWAISKDKDLTLTNKLYVSENPLFLGEYRQVFENSNLILDFGFTEGYKKTSAVKTSDQKTHFFSKLVKNFYNNENKSENTLSITTQEVSNDKYFKLYKINSELVDDGIDTLKNTLSFTHSSDKNFFGLDVSMYETLKSGYNDKYEYIYPELTFNKNLLSSSTFGSIDLDSNLKIRNYDTNKTSKFLVNNLDWSSIQKNLNSGVQTQFLSKIKNVNYEAKNIKEFKNDTTNEIFGALGLLTKLDLYKKIENFSEHYFSPKMLLRYAPGQMKKETSKTKLNPSKAFDLNRLNNNNNFETGLSATVGFDYEIRKQNQKIDLSIGQIINQKENKNMPTSMGLDEKMSDVVGNSKITLNDNFSLNYNFAIDQNYKDFNYNEISAKANSELFDFDVSYLQEKKHIGHNEYIKSKIDYKVSKGTNLTYEFKRNLITNSSEFYNLGYEYANDCLRAGLVYRREFYNDSEIEAENSLMFKITLVPFGNLNSPKLNK